jgi:hypothetical protein
MIKNAAGQYLIVIAYDKTTGLPVTGDAANITATISKDGSNFVATNDVNPTELTFTSSGNGRYRFTLTQAETNCNLFYATITSVTSNVLIGDVNIETISDSYDSNTGIVYDYTVTDGTNPIADVLVEAKQGGVLIQSQRTGVDGVATFYLQAGSYDFYSMKTGYSFTNPDTETVS